VENHFSTFVSTVCGKVNLRDSVLFSTHHDIVETFFPQADASCYHFVRIKDAQTVRFSTSCGKRCGKPCERLGKIGTAAGNLTGFPQNFPAEKVERWE
jgi:hypothetical protein